MTKQKSLQVIHLQALSGYAAEQQAFLIKRMLSKGGLSEDAQTAHNGLEGLARVREAAEQGMLPQLILVDINMPVMDGFEFLQELAKLELNLTDTKVVLVSSSQNPQDREKAVESSANYFLHKPLTEEKLGRILE